jgi:hypothetical protein
MRMRSALTVVITLIAVSLKAQQPQDRSLAEQYRIEQEQRRKAMLMQVMDSAITHMEHAEYAAADEKFLYVLNNIKGVPSDLTFYFGKNSYFLKKYKQSVDWLNKYIQLKGTTGQYFTEATEYLKKAEAEVMKERAADAQKVKQVLSQQYDIDCGPTGKVTCPVCKGTTVIVRRGAFGNTYNSCGFCDTHGTLTCDEYNQLIRGELKPKN